MQPDSMTTSWNQPEPKVKRESSGLDLLDRQLDRMDQMISLAEERLGPILRMPMVGSVRQDTPTPESQLRTRVERLDGQCARWHQILVRADL